MTTAGAMQRPEKVADRAGSLVTERVRAVIETATARAERVRRDAADEARRLDSRRFEAASRIVSQVDDLEGVLGRMRQQMQAEQAVEGSFDEVPLIEEGAATAPSAAAAVEVEEAPPEVEETAAVADKPEVVDEPPDGGAPAEVEDAREPAADTGQATTETTGHAGPAPAEDSESGDRAARSPFSFLRRRESHEEAGPAPSRADEIRPDQDEQHMHSCAVCGRVFAGDENELRYSGWVASASGEVTCSDCRTAGWLRPSG